jgi:hypothetical protein
MRCERCCRPCWQKLNHRDTETPRRTGFSSAGGAKRRVRTSDPVETSRRWISSDLFRPDHSSERGPGCRLAVAGPPAELDGPRVGAARAGGDPRRDKNSVISAALFPRRGGEFHRSALRNWKTCGVDATRGIEATADIRSCSDYSRSISRRWISPRITLYENAPISATTPM